MSITKEILSMLEFNCNPKFALSVNTHFDECPPSKQRSVPTVRWPYRLFLSVALSIAVLQKCRSVGAPL